MTKNEWIAFFANEVMVYAEPGVPHRLARTVAGERWAARRHDNPSKVAREWITESGRRIRH